jgi:hypothetical protein
MHGGKNVGMMEQCFTSLRLIGVSQSVKASLHRSDATIERSGSKVTTAIVTQ